MKRLRSLSIRDSEALDRLNRKRAWGQMYWRKVNARKRREWELRQMRHSGFVQHIRIEPEVILPGEASLEEAPPARVRH